MADPAEQDFELHVFLSRRPRFGIKQVGEHQIEEHQSLLKLISEIKTKRTVGKTGERERPAGEFEGGEEARGVSGSPAKSLLWVFLLWGLRHSLSGCNGRIFSSSSSSSSCFPGKFVTTWKMQWRWWGELLLLYRHYIEESQGNGKNA